MIPAWGSPVLLQEALKNLLDNAVRYQEAGGKVDIVVVATPAPGFTIEDSGPGIPEGEMSAVFQRFRRGDRSDGGSTDGSGLGLAIVHEIASGHYGSVTLSRGAGGRGLLIRFELGTEPISLSRRDQSISA